MSIGKLITSPIQCGYRQFENKMFICMNSNLLHYRHQCTDIRDLDFPTTCPLKNAIAIEQISGFSTTVVMKKRNRNDCKYFRRNKVLNCTCHRIIKSDCVGVNCGHYAEKDH